LSRFLVELEERAAEYGRWVETLRVAWVEEEGLALGWFEALRAEGRLEEVEAWLEWPLPPDTKEGRLSDLPPSWVVDW
jgi:hypothetical protein